MSLPDLCLAPHEVGDLAPDVPWCAPAIERVRVRRWFKVEHYLARVIKDSSRRTSLVARQQQVEAAPLLYFGFHSDEELDDLSAIIKSDDFRRILRFDSTGKLNDSVKISYPYLSISHFGLAYWHGSDGESRVFRWEDEQGVKQLSRRWIKRAPEREIERDVARMLRDPGSDCAFVWRWVQLSQREKIGLIFSVRPAVLERCEQLVKAFSWSDPLWPEHGPWRWTFQVGLSSPLAAMRNNFIVGRVSNGSKYSGSCARREILPRLILNYLNLHRDNTMQQKILPQHNYHLEHQFWRVDVAEPSAHERIEAHLMLREFLKDWVSSDELAELMEQ